jgi:hypothetical protein
MKEPTRSDKDRPFPLPDDDTLNAECSKILLMFVEKFLGKVKGPTPNLKLFVIAQAETSAIVGKSGGFRMLERENVDEAVISNLSFQQ